MNIEYTQVDLRNLRILVPKKIGSTEDTRDLPAMLFSHEDTHWKVWGKLPFPLLIILYLRENPYFQEEVKYIDFTNPDNFPKVLEKVLLSTKTAWLMALVFKYFDLFEEKYENTYNKFYVNLPFPYKVLPRLYITPMDTNHSLAKKSSVVKPAISEVSLSQYEACICVMLRCQKRWTKSPLNLNNLKLDEIIPSPPIQVGGDKQTIVITENDYKLTITDKRCFASTDCDKIAIAISLDALAYIAILYHQRDDYTKVKFSIENFSRFFDDALEVAVINLLKGSVWDQLSDRYSLLDRLIIRLDAVKGFLSHRDLYVEGVDNSSTNLFTKRVILEKKPGKNEIANSAEVVEELLDEN